MSRWKNHSKFLTSLQYTTNTYKRIATLRKYKGEAFHSSGQATNPFESTIVGTNLLDSPYDFASWWFLVEVSSHGPPMHSTLMPHEVDMQQDKVSIPFITPPVQSERFPLFWVHFQVSNPLGFQWKVPPYSVHRASFPEWIENRTFACNPEIANDVNLKLFRAATGFDLIFFTGLQWVIRYHMILVLLLDPTHWLADYLLWLCERYGDDLPLAKAL